MLYCDFLSIGIFWSYYVKPCLCYLHLSPQVQWNRVTYLYISACKLFTLAIGLQAIYTIIRTKTPFNWNILCKSVITQPVRKVSDNLAKSVQLYSVTSLRSISSIRITITPFYHMKSIERAKYVPLMHCRAPAWLGYNRANTNESGG